MSSSTPGSPATEPKKPSIYNLWTVLFAAAALAALYVFFLNPVIDFTEFNADDPSAYIGRAVSLTHGLGYGENFADGFYPVKLQPPGFSLLLAPVVKIFGVDFFALKAFMLLTAAALAASLYYFFGTFLPVLPPAAPLLTLLVMANPAVFGLSHRVLAEIPYMAALVLALALLDDYLKEKGVLTKKLWPAVFCTVLAYFFKETALAVVIGAWLLLLHPRFRTKEVFMKLYCFSVLAAVPVALWMFHTSHIPGKGFWAQSTLINFTVKNPYEWGNASPLTFGDMLVRMRQNIVWGLVPNTGMLALPALYFSPEGHAPFLIALPAFLWLGFKMVRSWKEKPSVLIGFVLVTVLVLLPKLEGSALRYIVPLYPAFLVFAGQDLWASRRTARFLFGTVFLLGFGISAAAGYRQRINPYGSPVAEDFVAAAARAKKFFPADSKCLAPVRSSWQDLTGHLCYTSSEDADRADYYVVLSDQAMKMPRPRKDFPLALFKRAEKIRNNTARLGPMEKFYENTHFTILKKRLSAGHDPD